MKLSPILFTLIALSVGRLFAAEVVPDLKADGWVTLGKADFVPVNTGSETWQWKEDGSLHCTGLPIGVMRTAKEYQNFEMSLHWNHRSFGGNSGVFVWCQKEALDQLTKPGLPSSGIEIQILDLGYTEVYEKQSGKKGDWFTCHGDVFAVGTSKMKPFAPLSPNGSRSFPSKNVSKGMNQWNHYFIRAIDGRIHLWVNGEQVSGGENCDPATGFLCLESEGGPIDFKEIQIRELPKK